MTPEANELVKKLCSHYKFDAMRLFDNMLRDCMATIMRDTNDSGHRLDRPWDDEMHEIMHDMSGTYAKLVCESEPLIDILGPVYQELSSQMSKKRTGAFFTPPSLCSMMAKMNLMDTSVFENQDVVTLQEPAVGCGAMVLSFVQELILVNPDYVKKLNVTAIDLDVNSCRSFSVQMFANALYHEIQLDGVHVYRGSTIGPLDQLQYFWGYSTGREISEKEDTKLCAAA